MLMVSRSMKLDLDLSIGMDFPMDLGPTPTWSAAYQTLFFVSLLTLDWCLATCQESRPLPHWSSVSWPCAWFPWRSAPSSFSSCLPSPPLHSGHPRRRRGIGWWRLCTHSPGYRQSWPAPAGQTEDFQSDGFTAKSSFWDKLLHDHLSFNRSFLL